MKAFQLNCTPVGGAGVATVVVTQKVPAGQLIGVQVNYTTQPATTDVTIKSTGEGGVQKTLLTLTNRNTDLPMATIGEPMLDSAGATLADTTKNPNIALPAVAGSIEVTVAQGDPVANGVIVTLLIQDR
jgi:hypothetical protein